jgi:hypothetical protein
LEAKVWGREGGGGRKRKGKGGVMTQSLYAHMNKGNKKKLGNNQSPALLQYLENNNGAEMVFCD